MRTTKSSRTPRNKFERTGYNTLKKSKAKFEYEAEKIPYVIHGNYIPDFILTTKKSKKKIYIEFKGHFRPEAKRKMVAVRQGWPDFDIRFVFYSHRKEYIKFCEKYGFQYAIGEIPKEWINE